MNKYVYRQVAAPSVSKLRSAVRLRSYFPLFYSFYSSGKRETDHLSGLPRQASAAQVGVGGGILPDFLAFLIINTYTKDPLVVKKCY